MDADRAEAWERDGFFILEGFAPLDVLEAMRETVVDLARRADRGESIAPAYVQEEKKIATGVERPEERLSKLFRVHREQPVFRRFAEDPALLDLVGSVLGPDLDCFLSQFIFKLPGALGQPWHQDAFYFPFDRGPQVGVWLAITEATEHNGPLWVLPGSHGEPVHRVEADHREHANLGYVEIVDHDMSGARPVMMQAGDLLVFHSHLMHSSTDNASEHERAAMVYHYAAGGTVDQSMEKWGFTPPNTDFMPVRRAGRSPQEV